MAEGEGDSSTGFRGRTIAHEAPRIGDVYGASTPFAPGESWPTRVDELLLDGVDREGVEWFQSACVLCSNGCGLDIAVSEGRIVGVRGRGDDRVNQGRLGPKGLYGWQANNAPDRLTHPLVRRNGALEQATWDEALDLVVERTRRGKWVRTRIQELAPQVLLAG